MIVNMTPHPVNVGGVTIPPEEETVRLAERNLGGRFQDVEGLAVGVAQLIEGEPVLVDRKGRERPFIPDPNIVYVVSRPVAQAVRLPNVVCPHGHVRDKDGNIVGAEGLAYYAPRQPDAGAAAEPSDPQRARVIARVMYYKNGDTDNWDDTSVEDVPNDPREAFRAGLEHASRLLLDSVGSVSWELS